MKPDFSSNLFTKFLVLCMLFREHEAQISFEKGELQRTCIESSGFVTLNMSI